MTNDNQWNPFDDDGDDSSLQSVPKALREWAKGVAADNKTLKEEIAKLRKEQTGESVSKVLEGLGFDPRAAEFYPDNGDSSKSAIADWANARKDILPRPAASASSSDGNDGGDDDDKKNSGPPKSTVEPQLQDVITALQEQGVLAPPGTDDLMAKVLATNTEEELTALIRAHS